MKKVVAGLCLALASGVAFAQLPNNDPTVACSYLAEEHLAAGEWQVDDKGAGRCASALRGFGRESIGALNLLSYEARGNATSAQILQVILDVNPDQALSDANKAFLQAAQRLSVNAFGKRLPSTISSAITGGREASAAIGSSQLSVSRQQLESGAGYQMRFSIQ